MRETHYISRDILDLPQIQEILEENKLLALSDEAKVNIDKARTYLDKKMDASQEPFYGINTGFGSLCNVKISREHLVQLQENLVISHACGTGDKVSPKIVKLMLLLKIQSLSYGNSGITQEVVLRLIDFFNEGVLPVVYEQGSLGASGDLAPLAHLSLPLLGKGEVYVDGEIYPATEILQQKGWEPLNLRSKEGLALLNGTQFMSAHAVFSLIEAYKLSYLADAIGAVSVDGFDCNLSPFDPLVHYVRPHRGQVKTAERMLEFLEGSEIAEKVKESVQDPYSFRCIPQVHGASKDTIRFVHQTVKTEINSVTDNPNIFVEEDKIISGGNFHGQPLALAMDYLAIALAELANISERRIYQLVSGLRDLPMFLVDDPGLNNGFMIPQYTAASIVSQNKQLCTPASVDSIVSSNGQEDHVSMGANAATKLVRVVENLKSILAIELFNASQALYYREPLKSSDFIMQLVNSFREEVPVVKQDKVMAEEIAKAKLYLTQFGIDQEILFNM
ncbi:MULTISPECIES: histidine ammonia-lyase [Mesonia]|uniref:Histidine ammonia-lyase n=1 Tax=Mesonia oceanica TaxID=2687242 RepID=A0AC61YCK5_9FLAO|nr:MULTISPECIES: histidine ammonia-lyase [Mesonia]MAN27175.1 histidine ammonia-lyase [Mesonia sp.]MAQ42060.1 histidine ammonia-lyase [Mesonia sp.]MBJ97583.1 histidine ammonia-lyase [Flavobacteriaceae bacterium]VVV02166.1 Histidine ammonia-lyase [Mesonia oceanica]|tara:strand:- start:17718 stop:19232 length:1515 start_codon:yes stop_codon:yes gene_type:complete